MSGTSWDDSQSWGLGWKTGDGTVPGLRDQPLGVISPRVRVRSCLVRSPESAGLTQCKRTHHVTFNVT